MRHFVRDRIASALERTRPSLEGYVSRHLKYPPGFPYKLAQAVVLVRGFRQLNIARWGRRTCRRFGLSITIDFATG